MDDLKSRCKWMVKGVTSDSELSGNKCLVDVFESHFEKVIGV